MWRRVASTRAAGVHGLRTWVGLRAWRDLACPEGGCSRSVTRRRLTRWVQRLKKRHQCSRFRRAQVFSIGGHVPATLNYLANELVFGEVQGHTVQRRPALASSVIQRMTVVTLLSLKNECTPTLQGRSPLQEFRRNRLAAPGIHHGAPGRVLSQMSQGAEHYCDQQNHENCDWPPLPALLTFACYKRERQQDNDADGRTNQQYRGLGGWGQEREESIKPQKEEVGMWRGLNNGRVWLAAWTKGAEIHRAHSDRQKDKTGEQYVLPHRIRHEWHTLQMRQLAIFLEIGVAPDNAARHWPFVDSQFQHHQQVNADKGNQQSG